MFLARRDVRKEMLFISVIFGFGGLACQKTNLVDWWKPITITGTTLGIEDFIIGFAIGGISAVVYEEIYKKRLRKSRTKFPRDPGLYLLSFPVIYLIAFYMIRLGSFYSAILAYSVCGIYLLYTRRDLLKDSLLSGFFLLIIATIIYLGLFFVFPDYINQFWYLKPSWYTTLLWGVPIAEYIWIFFTGAYIGPLYEYIYKKRLR